MLNDRDYMNNQKKFSINDVDPIKCVYWLIGINIFMFMFVAPPAPGQMINTSSSFYNFLLMSSIDFSTVYRCVTAIFLHGSFNHLFFNMFNLFIFGKFVAPQLGSKRFIQLFIASGVIGNVLWLFSSVGSYSTLVGASGGVFGVMIAAALLAPNLRVMLLIPPVPMKLKTLAMVFGGLQVLFALAGPKGNIAYIAHIGGIIGGYIMLRYVFKLKVWDVKDYFFGRKAVPPKTKPFTAPKGWSVKDYTAEPKEKPVNVKECSDDLRGATGDVAQKEVDRILDKISSTGMSSLTAEEQAALKSARSKMKRD